MEKQISNYDFIEKIKNNYHGDDICKEILTQYLKNLIESYPEKNIDLTPKKHTIYIRNLFACFGVSMSNRTRSIYFTVESKKNNIFFDAFRNIRPKIRSHLHKDYMDKYKTDDFILENEIIVLKLLIFLLEKKQIKIELNKREQDGYRYLSYILQITDLSKENSTPEQKRERMILDYVNGHNLNEDERNKLYHYISKGMLGNNGLFRARNQNECVYNKSIAPKANFVIIPNKIDAGYTTHIIESFIIAITNNNKCIWDFKFYNTAETKNNVIIENDKIIIPDEIFLDIINKVDYLNGNNKQLTEDTNENHLIKGLDIDCYNCQPNIAKTNLLKTIFSSASTLNVKINIERCKQEGLIFPKIIRKHIEKRFNRCIRSYDIHRKSKELFDPAILKTVLGFIRSPRLYDYNWLCGTLSIHEENITNNKNLATNIPNEIRSRNRIQALKAFSGIYNILQHYSIEIDNGITIDSILKQAGIPKKMKKYFSCSFKQLVNKKTSIQKKIKQIATKELKESKELDDEMSLIIQRISMHNMAKHHYINYNVDLSFKNYHEYLNRLFSTFNDINTLNFCKSLILKNNLLFNIFFYNCFKQNQIYLKPINMKNISLGKTQQDISDNIELLVQAPDILMLNDNYMRINRHRNIINENIAEDSIENDGDFRRILIYGTEVCLPDIIKQSKEYHKNINYIQTAINNVKNRFSVTLPPEEQCWDKIMNDVSYADGHISFFTNRDELIIEGKKMSHCVGGYGNKCVYDYRTHIASITDDDGNSSTIEYNIDKENKVNIIQNRGMNNQKPTQKCEQIGLKTIDLIQKKLTPDFIEFLKNEAEKRKAKRKDTKNNNYITEIYKQELLDLGYNHYDDYLKTEKFNILKLYLNKTFRKMTYNEACEYIQNFKNSLTETC